MSELIKVNNPYPEWQGLASETNCWNCYKLLWQQPDVFKHLCSDCQQTHITTDTCLGCSQSPCTCAAEIESGDIRGRRKAS